jgi:MFS family permease
VITGDELAEFEWNSTITSWILSSFYWMYVVSQVVGGVATQKFGTKAVFGWSQLATALGSLCIPIAASTHWSLLILVRSIQGFAR